VVCNDGEVCPADTDLAGVLVVNAPEDCNIFATCNADDPLGQALGLNATETVEVADEQLCGLEVPEPVRIVECPSLPTAEVPNPNPNMAGENVTSFKLCEAATPAVQCGPDTTLEGVWVTPGDEATCELAIPPAIVFPICPPGSNLAGANVTDLRLCNAATPAEQCPSGTDLAGVFFNSTLPGAEAVCNQADGVTQFETQCLKCADLAALNAAQGGFNRAQESADQLIGNLTDNVFTICAADNIPDATAAFNATITGAQEDEPEDSFAECLNNAAAVSGNGAQLQSQMNSLQENSYTTNVRPESGISTFSPPSIPSVQSQGTGDLTAMEKITKLKQQWLDLLS
jgi:hypothetical protein